LSSPLSSDRKISFVDQANIAGDSRGSLSRSGSSGSVIKGKKDYVQGESPLSDDDEDDDDGDDDNEGEDEEEEEAEGEYLQSTDFSLPGDLPSYNLANTDAADTSRAIAASSTGPSAATNGEVRIYPGFIRLSEGLFCREGEPNVLLNEITVRCILRASQNKQLLQQQANSRRSLFLSRRAI
jgi:hypothetical protein